MLDAFRDAHGGPTALTAVVGTDGGVEGGECGLGIQQRCAAQNHLFILLLAGQVHRAADRRQGATPDFQLAFDEVLALLKRLARAVWLRDLGGSRKQRAEEVFGTHEATPYWLCARRLEDARLSGGLQSRMCSMGYTP
ncbi:hypothetical protein D3C85_1193340 [compost metagenome]